MAGTDHRESRRIPGGRPLLVGTALVLAAAAIACRARRAGQPSPTPTSMAPPALEERARSSAQAFLDGYIDPDGRVVRRDQGGDTVSEGQSYAMLTAVALGDRR